MAVRDGRLRSEVDRFEHGGYAVTIVDGEAALAEAAGRRVELLRDATFPPSVREATLSVTRDPQADTDRYLLDAGARIGPELRPALSSVGSDPVGVLLTWRARVGDRWASRVVDGIDVVTGQVSRWLSPARLAPPSMPAPSATPARESQRVDGDVVAGRRDQPLPGSAGRRITLHAAVPAARLAVEHLRSMCRLLIDAVTEVAGNPSPDAHVTLSAVADDGEVVTLDQVGGLGEIVGRLREVAVSFRHPEAMARWGARRPQGILLYGPPGTGKTMLARALANEIGATLQEIHTPDILDKWLGASERNIKAIFGRARRYRQPTVMLFDEFDSIIGYAGDGDDSGSQAINAVAGIFKQEMNDLITANPRVIVMATTNFPDRVDASLIRSGRFDVKLRVPPPDHTGRVDILVKMIRRLIAAHEFDGFVMFADDVDVDALATRADDMTGADLAEALRRAQLGKAMREARTGSGQPAISQADLMHHLTQLRHEAVPSAAHHEISASR